MTCELQNQAFLNLFLAIIQENGYYTELRQFFMKEKGFNFADMAEMLNNSYEDCPDGMSPYYYMDSLEDMLMDMNNQNREDIHDISDLVNAVWEQENWKEY